MVSKSIISVISVCLAITSMNASAIPSNIIDNGGYTTDTTAGLDWLDFSYTSNISYNDAEASASLVEGGGWSYASKAQVQSLFSSIFELIKYHVDGIATLQNSPQVDDFTALLGPSDAHAIPDTYYSFSHGMFLDDASNLRLSGVSDAKLLQYDDFVFGSNVTNQLHTSHLTQGAITLSTYLVRDAVSAPEPSIAILMASGLIVFGVVRRKSRV